MKKILSTPYFSFNPKVLDKGMFSEQICHDNIFSNKVAKPLFDIGLLIAAITEREKYDSGGVGMRKYNVFTLVLQGQMEIILDEKIRSVGAGELIWAPAETAFRRTAKENVWWMYFDLIDNNFWKALKDVGPYVRLYENAELMFLHLRKIIDAFNNGSAQSAALALDSSRFLVSLLRHEITLASRGLSQHTVLLQNLMDKISSKPQLNWTIEEMAECTTLSKSHFSHLFQKEFGLSPIDAVIKQRMRKAIHLLVHTKDSVEQIARHAGYGSVYSFTRLFTKHVGVSPGKYRKGKLRR